MAENVNVTRTLVAEAGDGADRAALPDWQATKRRQERPRARLTPQAWLTLCVLAALVLAALGAFLYQQWLILDQDVPQATLFVRLLLLVGLPLVGLLGLAQRLLVSAKQAGVVRLENDHPVSVDAVLAGQLPASESLALFYGVQREWAANSALRSLNQLDLSSTKAAEKPAEPLALPAPVEPLTIDQALLQLPQLVRYAELASRQPTRWSVPLGIDQDGAERWADVQRQMLHVGIWGTTGAGKENLFQGWFLRLAQSNDPQHYQAFVLDGKGHWLQPKFADLAHMWRPPVGGIGASGDQALRQGLRDLQAEMARRGQLVFGANCETADQYTALTGEALPILHVFISDVMSSVSGEIERTLIDLVSKARALGIRVVASMQTPTGKEMAWRTNLSTVLCGAMQDASQDSPALGIRDGKLIRFRPSQLPSSSVRPGTFVARFNSEQCLLQTPYLPPDEFNAAMVRLPSKRLTENDLRLHRRPEAPSFDGPPSAPSAQTAGDAPLFDAEHPKDWLVWKFKNRGMNRESIRQELARLDLALDNNEYTEILTRLGL